MIWVDLNGTRVGELEAPECQGAIYEADFANLIFLGIRRLRQKIDWLPPEP